MGDIRPVEIEGSRKEFERWALQQGDSLSRTSHWGANRPYDSTFTEWEWRAWKAALAAHAPSLEAPDSEPCDRCEVIGEIWHQHQDEGLTTMGALELAYEAGMKSGQRAPADLKAAWQKGREAGAYEAEKLFVEKHRLGTVEYCADVADRIRALTYPGPQGKG